MCKAKVISDRASLLLRPFPVAFVGDNLNDLCPALRSPLHAVFPRRGYPMHRELERREQQREQEEEAVCCPSFPWDSGEEILDVLRRMMAKGGRTSPRGYVKNVD